jgi:peptidoglycan/LPS O-acetylase OafA/YrhL
VAILIAAMSLGSKPSWGGRLVGVEGLRAIAALSVLFGHVIAHGSPSSHLGIFDDWLRANLDSGLTLFFTLSGFLLYRPFAAAVLRGTKLPSARGYLRNRALRILPAYWVILLLVALVLGAAVLQPSAAGVGYMTDPSLLVRNLLLVQTYTQSGVVTGNSSSWSLSVEIVFYLVLPLLAVVAARVGEGGSRRRRLSGALVPAAALLALGIAGKLVAASTMSGDREVAQWGSSWHAVLERSFFASADLFAFGMAAAVIVVAADDRWFVAPRMQRACGVAAVALTAVLAAVRHYEGLNVRPFNTVMALACALLVLWITLPWRGGRSTPVRMLESRPVVWIGVTSYSVYLWHAPVIDWLRAHGALYDGSGSAVINTLFVLAIVMPLAGITYRFVEAPAMRRKARSGTVTTSDGTTLAPELATAAAAP